MFVLKNLKQQFDRASACLYRIHVMSVVDTKTLACGFNIWFWTPQAACSPILKAPRHWRFVRSFTARLLNTSLLLGRKI